LTLSAARVVVNADDLGMTREISKGIVEAHVNGIVTSASLMVTTPWAGEGAAEAARCPEMGVGVHLTLTCGVPAASPFEVPSLVDDRGRLTGITHFIARWAAGHVKPYHLETEFGAQIRKAMALGVRPTHLDSHHHLHLLPGILKIVLKLAADHGIGMVRFPRQWHLRPLNVNALRNWWMRVLTLENRRSRLWSENVRSADQLWIIFPGGRRPLWTLYRKALEDAGKGLHEFVCHPGFSSPELEEMDPYTRERETELTALSHSELREVVRRRGIQLAHFGSFI